MATTIRLDSPAGLAACVPSLLGFVPDPGSVIVVSIVGKHLGMIMRMDLIPSGPPDSRFGPTATLLADGLRRGEPEFTHAELIGWETATGDLDELYSDLGREGVPLGECLTVQQRDGEWQVLDTCPSQSDPQWVPLGEDVVRPVATVEFGTVIAGSRTELAQRVAAGNAPLTDAQAGLARRLAHKEERVHALVHLARLETDDLRVMREEFSAVARAYPPGDPSRDGALMAVAITSWLTGDGAMALVALEASSPDYTLARILSAAFTATLRPGDLRQMLLTMEDPS